MNKKTLFISMGLLFSSFYGNASASLPNDSSETEAQQTDDLGTEIDQKVAQLIEQLTDKVNTQSEQISDLQKRVSDLESIINSSTKNNMNENMNVESPYN